MGVETAGFRLLNSFCANGLYDAVLPVITKDSTNLAILAGLCLLALLAAAASGSRTRLLLALRVVVVAALAVGLGELIGAHWLKETVGRPRPPLVLAPESVRLLVGLGTHASFPSSHAVNTFAVMTALALGYPGARFWYLGYAALIAFSRVYVGVHWPSDVLCGMVLGMALAWALWRASGRLVTGVKREMACG